MNEITLRDPSNTYVRGSWNVVGIFIPFLPQGDATLLLVILPNRTTIEHKYSRMWMCVMKSIWQHFRTWKYSIHIQIISELKKIYTYVTVHWSYLIGLRKIIHECNTVVSVLAFKNTCCGALVPPGNDRGWYWNLTALPTCTAVWLDVSSCTGTDSWAKIEEIARQCVLYCYIRCKPEICDYVVM